MRHGRWIVPCLGAALAVVLALPAGAAPTVRDQSILDAGVVTKRDVPKSWSGSKQPDFSLALRGVPACASVLAASTLAQQSPHKNSLAFTDKANAQLTNAENQAYAFKTPAAASDYLAAFQDLRGAACFQGLVQRAGANAGAQPQISVGALTLPGLGNQAVGYVGQLTFVIQNQPLNLFIDEIAVRVGRSTVVFQFDSPDQQIVQGPGIVRAVLTRLQRVGA
jgi:hypothetical protein